ncbi:hypothetical protein HCUR_01068 [Holospora curviuscula]|uniref:Transposase IS66 family protein n=1 Tax=Holospora curviuscula TaxID=1082868 RepID=A0A2S5R868_9PROT|nr:hypothetical protein HCUR_01068 [Holospora curviuscula]
MFAKRWVLEQTLAWLNHYPRLSKAYESAVASVENRVMIGAFYWLVKADH